MWVWRDRNFGQILVSPLEQGRINPRISQTIRFSELPEALQMIKDRKVAGRAGLSE